VGNGKPPSRRSGTGASLVRHGILPGSGATVAMSTPEPMVVVFGGLATRGANQESYMNDVHIWALRGASRWVALRTIEGRAPMPRCYHCATAIGSKLIIFGGNNQRESFSDLAYLECTPTVSAPDTWSWHWPAVTGAGPRARTGATATAIGDRFVLYVGGWDPNMATSKKVATSTTSTTTTTTTTTSAGRPNSRGAKRGGGGGGGGGVSDISSTTGAGVPGPFASRLAAAAAADVRTGEDDAEPFPEAWLLDTREWTWMRVAADITGSSGGSSSNTPSPESILLVKNAAGRAGHSSTLLSDARSLLRRTGAAGADSIVPVPALLIYGGVKADGEKHGDITLLLLPPALIDVGKEATLRLVASRSPPSKREITREEDVDIPAGQVD
jgi:hypothetical protein